jgi:hypothetical protein
MGKLYTIGIVVKFASQGNMTKCTELVLGEPLRAMEPSSVKKIMIAKIHTGPINWYSCHFNLLSGILPFNQLV